MLPAIGAALITGGSALAGSVINGLSQASANKSAERMNAQNIQMQRETNEQQYRMFNEQNAFNERMWNMQNAYNDPSAQVKRLTAAGINPAMVFGNGSISEAGGLQSGSAPSLTAPSNTFQKQPLDIGGQLAEGAYTAINAFNQSELQRAQSDNIRSQTTGQDLKNKLDLAQLFDKIDSLRIDNKEKQRLYEFALRTQSVQESFLKGSVQKQQAETDLLAQQLVSTQLHDRIDSMLATSTVKLNNANIRVLNATVSQIVQNTAYLLQLTEHERVKAIGTIIENGMKGIDYQIKQETKDAAVDLFHQNVFNAQQTGEALWQDNQYAPISPIAPFIQVQKGYHHNPNRKY